MSVGAIAHSIGNPRASTESPAVTGPDGLVFPSLAIANANAAASPTLQSPLQGAWGAPGPPGVRRRVSVEGSSRPRGLEAGPALVEGASWWGGRALRAEGPAVGYPSPRSAGLRGFDPRALFWPGLSPSSEAPDGAGGMGRGDSGLFGRAEGNSVDMERGPEGAAAGPTEGPGEAGGPEALPLWRRSSLYEAERGPGVKRGGMVFRIGHAKLGVETPPDLPAPPSRRMRESRSYVIGDVRYYPICRAPNAAHAAIQGSLT